MKTRINPLLWVSAAGMELCWLYAWVVFFGDVFQLRSFPLTDGAASLLAGAFVARLAGGKGFRIVTVLLLHLIGLALVLLWAVYSLPVSGGVFLSWPGRFPVLTGPSGFPEWALVTLTTFWATAFWLSGITLARRPKTYYAFCARFDIGLASFFCLFLAGLVMFAKGGVRFDDRVSWILTLLFLLCGLFSVGISRFQYEGLKDFLPGYRRIGIILGYAFAVILAVGGSVLWSLARLGSLAAGTHRAMNEFMAAAQPAIEQLFRIVFSRGEIRPEAAASPSKAAAWNLVTHGKGSWLMEYVDKVLGWGLWGIFSLLSLIVLALVGFLTLKWLLSKTSSDAEAGRNRNPRAAWLSWLRDLLRLFAGTVRRIRKGYSGASDIYGGLLRWALRSGMSPLTGETPLEFGKRLSRYIPRFRPEIDIIVDSYNREIYGEMSLAGSGRLVARRAWRSLRNPLYWPLRVKARFTGPPRRFDRRGAEFPGREPLE